LERAEVGLEQISLEEILLEEGKSRELKAVFEIIRDTTDGDEPKFSTKTCRDLARVITCRTYGSAALELCHLLTLATACDGATARYENFFWASGPARSHGFRAYVNAVRSLPSGVQIKNNGVELDYGDGVFTITFSRMPFLSAFLEFTVTALGYDVLDTLAGPLCKALPSVKTVAETANMLSRQIYNYLKDHLPTLQVQRKQRSFLQFLTEQTDSGVDASSINDDSVLEYWLESTADCDSGVDIKTYQSVFLMAVRIWETQRLAREQYDLDHPLSIGTDREGGEVDPELIEETIIAIDEVTRPLDALHESPVDQIKFLNKRETEFLEGIIFGSDVTHQLTVSTLRNAVFGKTQSRITNALRKKINNDDLNNFIESATETSYQETIEQYHKLIDHLEGMIHASLYAMVCLERSETINLIFELCPDADLGNLMDNSAEPEWADENIVSFQAETAMKRFLKCLRQHDTLPNNLGTLMHNAQKAYKNTSRQGFRDSDFDIPELGDGFGQGISSLLAVKKELKSFLNNPIGRFNWSQQFDGDSKTFKKQFQTLYGAKYG